MSRRDSPRRVPRPNGESRDEGVATILACVCGFALVALTAMVLYLGAVVLARHRAEVAADAGALAGAGVVLQGEEAACDRAAIVVRANGASVSTCLCSGLDVLVTVTVTVRWGPLGSSATGRARAGPVVAVSE